MRGRAHWGAPPSRSFGACGAPHADSGRARFGGLLRARRNAAGPPARSGAAQRRWCAGAAGPVRGSPRASGCLAVAGASSMWATAGTRIWWAAPTAGEAARGAPNSPPRATVQKVQPAAITARGPRERPRQAGAAAGRRRVCLSLSVCVCVCVCDAKEHAVCVCVCV